jgi:hypothetical protein
MDRAAIGPRVTRAAPASCSAQAVATAGQSDSWLSRYRFQSLDQIQDGSLIGQLPDCRALLLLC